MPLSLVRPYTVLDNGRYDTIAVSTMGVEFSTGITTLDIDFGEITDASNL